MPSPPCTRCGEPLDSAALSGLCSRCWAGSWLTPNSSDPSVPASFGPGVAVDGFILFEQLGRGGMGRVYRARQVALDRDVALKFFDPISTPSATQRTRFATEARAAARLVHPNIVSVFAVGEHGDVPYLAMELIEGESLADRLRSGPMPIRVASEILRAASKAVSHAHAHGVLHRDLKPANILLDLDGQPHLTDFGLAKLHDQSLELTGSLDILGSPAYMAPEQVRPDLGAPTTATDVYGLGATLYQSITGRPPFHGETVPMLLQQVTDQIPVSPRLLNPLVPLDLETITLKCLAKEPRHRYESASDLATELERFLNHEPIHARPPGVFERGWRWAQRHPLIATLVTTISLLLVAITVVSVLAAQRLELARQREAAGRDRAEAELYASDMVAVQKAMDDGNLGRAQNLLETHRPKSGEKDRRGIEWYLLQRQCRGSPHEILYQQPDGIAAMGGSGDHRHLAFVDEKGLKLFSLEQKRVIREWKLPPRPEERYVTFTPDDRWVVTTESTGIRFFNVTNAEERTLEVGECDYVSFSPDGKWLSVGLQYDSLKRWENSNVRVHRVNDGTRVGVLEKAGGKGIEWIGREALRVVSHRSGVVEWNFLNAEQRRILPETGFLESAAIRSDLNMLVTTDTLGLLIVRPLDGRPARTIATNAVLRESVLLIQTNRDGVQFIYQTTASQWAIIRDSGADLKLLSGHLSDISGGDLVGKSNGLISVGLDGTVREWTGEKSEQARLMDVELFTMNVSPPIVSSNMTTALANVQSGDKSEYVQLDLGSFEIKKRYLGQVVGTLTNNTAIVIMDRTNVVTRSLVHMSEDKLVYRALENIDVARQSKSGRRLGVLEHDDHLRVLDLNEPSSPVINPDKGWWFQFSPDETSAIVSIENRIYQWDFLNNKTSEIASVSTEEFCFSHDGSHLVVGTWDGAILLFDWPSKKLVRRFQAHVGGVLATAFSDGNRSLISSGEDQRLRIWNMETGREVGSFDKFRRTSWIGVLSVDLYLFRVGGNTLELIPIK